MKRYKQLTSEQRYQISGLRKAGWTQTGIADELGVNKSTISRESDNRGQPYSKTPVNDGWWLRILR